MLQKADPEALAARRPLTQRPGLRRALLIAGPLVVIVAGLALYLTGGRYAATDDAYVQAARADISTNIPGRVIEIAVGDNQPVRKGQVLFRLDPARYQIAVADAQAALDLARRKIPAMSASYRQHAADVAAARDALAYRQREYQLGQEILARLDLQVDLNAFFVPMQTDKVRCLHIIKRRTPTTGDVAGTWDLDFDNLGAKITKHGRAERASERMR